ncbi:hypothetical protein ACFFGH_34090 [Lysobacter korlensis]|uniref:Uncharacterized protein n=1 Tax=Lysobacter korlensis TaxID=553636 RepID=A0ABV6S1G0_9GAMM
MTKFKNAKVARLMPLLMVGMMLNALGIVFTSLGNVRFGLMAVGIAMIFAFLITAIAAVRSTDKPASP